jgi:hypothetical protein
MFLLELLRQPQVFFSRLKAEPVQLVLPCLLLFVVFMLSSFVPLLLGVLAEQDLLASIIFNAVALLVLLGCAALIAGGSRVLEVLGFSVLPLLLAMFLMSGLWFLGDVVKGLGSVLTLLALLFSFRLAWIGVLVMTQSQSVAWRTVLLAPLMTFLFMAVPFGLLVRLLGLA